MDECGHRPAGRVAGRNRFEGAQVGPHFFEVDFRREEAQALLRDLNLRREVIGLRCEDDDAGVEELLALDLGDDADDGIVVPGATATA